MTRKEAPSRTIVLRAAGALVGPDLELVSPVEIVISGNNITRIGAPDTPELPEGATDLGEVLLLPGFIDAHVHIGFFDPSTLVAGGVTTARDLAWPPERILPVVEASLEDEFEGPQVFAAGPMLTAPGGYPTRAGWAPPGTGVEVRSPEEGRSAVRQVVQDGAAVVKVALNPPVGPTLDLVTLTAIVEEAHAAGLRTTGHVYGLDQLEKALDAGLDELGHMLMSAEKISDATIERMVAQGMRVVPTLSIRFKRDQKVAIDNLKRFISAGGEVIYGTDLGNGGPQPGIDPREVEAMTRAGMSPREIVRSATVDSAGWLSLEDRGLLAQGMRADVIGVPMSALEDAAELTDLRLVVRAGTLVKEP